jgi:hypothetical protein
MPTGQDDWAVFRTWEIPTFHLAKRKSHEKI